MMNPRTTEQHVDAMLESLSERRRPAG
jgi:hypothetical protein